MRAYTALAIVFSALSFMIGRAGTLQAQTAGPTVRSLLTGYGAVGYGASDNEDFEHNFAATASLVPLFRVNDDIFVEAEIEFGLHDDATLVALEHAEVSYIGFERVQIKAGKFHVPFSLWMHPNWINKVPTPPLLYEDTHGGAASNGLLPILFDLGVQARWNVPLMNGWRTSVAFWVTQGPRPGTVHEHAGDEGTGDPMAGGEEAESDAPALAYSSNYEDNNSDKMTGAQLRMISASGLTLQASGFRAAYDDAGDLGVRALNLSMRLSPQSGALQPFDLRGEFVVMDQEFEHEEGIESVTSKGYYVQLSRRSGDFEPVVRWSHLPEAIAGEGPLVEERRQLALGLVYWMSPSVPLKTAYHIEADGPDALFIEWAVGF